MVRFIKDIRYGTMWIPGGLLVATWWLGVTTSLLVATVSCGRGYRRFMMGTWYGTLLISEYGITILILMVMVHFMVTLLYGSYTCFMIGFMLCTV